MTTGEAEHLVDTIKLWLERTYRIHQHTYHPQSREHALQASIEDELVKCLTKVEP